MSDSTLSEAIKEAYAAAPADEVIYHTLEIRHAAFAVPIRVVRDLVDLDATLEADAPEDALTEVTFTAYPFDIVPPEVSAEGSPRLAIEIDNVSREIVAAVELAMSSTDLLSVIYRSYVASDLTAPANDPPLTLTVFQISADPMRVRLVAGFQDVNNKRFPAGEYTAERFPGLVLQ